MGVGTNHWRKLKSWWQGKGRWAAVSAWMNQISDFLWYIDADPPIEYDITAKSIRFKLGLPLDPADGDMTSLGSAAEGSEAAESTTINFAADLAGNGLRLYMVSRVGYFESGDKTLYAYIRELRFDPYGRLAEVSAETRVAVDAAEEC